MVIKMEDWDLMQFEPVTYLGKLLCYDTIFFKIERYGFRRIERDET
jgi:hypothetical protein